MPRCRTQCVYGRGQDTVFLRAQKLAFHHSDPRDCHYHAFTCPQVFLISWKKLKTCLPAAAKNDYFFYSSHQGDFFCLRKCKHRHGDICIHDAHELAMKILALQKVSTFHFEETYPIKQDRQQASSVEK